MSPLLPIYRRLSLRLDAMQFAAPVAVVYNPLDYAAEPAERYLQRFGTQTQRVLFLGMNPGPFGMVQTGVPFGEVAAVRDWMKLSGKVEVPAIEHPKRMIEGFACKRSEVSGQRFWGFFSSTFGTADRFFAKGFVANYCPLAFLEATGANRTPDKLPAAEREPLFAACDEALVDVIVALAPTLVVGIGEFAKKRAELVTKKAGLLVPVGSILHPSPASPRANRGWADEARRGLIALGLKWPELAEPQA